jgi:hypothetical protein
MTLPARQSARAPGRASVPALGFGRGLVIVAALAGALHCARAVAASDFTVAELMRGLAARGADRAKFVERKYLAILDAPVVSTGELSYTPPDRLEKKTLTPKPESLVLEKGVLTLQRDQRKLTLRLAEYPQIAAIVDSLRGMLAGDRTALEKTYRMEAYGSRERWTLVLLPSDMQVAEVLQRIDVAGSGNRVRSIEIRQTDGDRSVMAIE